VTDGKSLVLKLSIGERSCFGFTIREEGIDSSILIVMGSRMETVEK
jgi:hypothetical protein